MVHFMAVKKIVVFMQEDLGIGGIENYIYRQAILLSKRDITTIWISGNYSYIAPSYEEGLKNCGLIIWKNRINRDELYRLTKGSRDAHIVFVTSYINWFVMAEEFRTKNTWCRMDNFFFVNHFTGWMNYLETVYPKFRRNSIRKRLSTVFSKMNNGGNIRYFSTRHIKVMEENYSYNAKGQTAVPSAFEISKFDEENARSLYRNKDFRLLSVSRFDFPHKGYLLGLISVYGKLKERYDRLKFTIVGYGSDEAQVHEAIAKLSEKAQTDIHLYGPASPEELVGIYRSANLNISAAGCCTTGARNGTLSLPVRNYCCDCEVYGYLPESKAMTVSTVPGMPAEGFIEEILNISEDEYVRKCKDSYDTFNDASAAQLLIEDLENSVEGAVLSEGDIRFVNKAFRKVMRKTKMLGYKNAIKEKGLGRIVKKRIKRLFRRNS